MLANINFQGQPQWRSHEREAAAEVFGGVQDFADASSRAFQEAEVVRWFPPSEAITPEGYLWMQAQRTKAAHGAHFHINDAQHYLRVHDKVETFQVWTKEGIPTPRWFTWEAGSFQDVSQGVPGFAPPFLLRLNNGVAGQDSWLVRSWQDLPGALEDVERCYHAVRASGRGAVTRLLCTKFVSTVRQGLNVSYRIIVAGGQVITGYARVSHPSDWVAVTNKFHAEMADQWLAANRRCQQIMTEHADLLVRAVGALGLNHQGVDVIESVPDGPNGQANLYFLEVQTTYDAGFIGCGPYQPPYYNPYNPELVKFLQENRALIEQELPLYTHRWLDKREHFRACYAALKESHRGTETQRQAGPERTSPNS